MEPKGAKKKPKFTQKEGKGSPRRPKGNPMGLWIAKWGPKGAQREPKWNQNEANMRSKNYEKTSAENTLIFNVFWAANSSTNQAKLRSEINPKPIRNGVPAKTETFPKNEIF